MTLKNFLSYDNRGGRTQARPYSDIKLIDIFFCIIKELLKCTADLDMKDTDVFKLSSRAIRSVVFDNFVNSCS